MRPGGPNTGQRLLNTSAVSNQTSVDSHSHTVSLPDHSLSNTHTHTLLRMHTHTHPHTHTYTPIHTHPRSRSHTQRHTHTHKHTHSHTHTGWLFRQHWSMDGHSSVFRQGCFEFQRGAHESESEQKDCPGIHCSAQCEDNLALMEKQGSKAWPP